jgi:hypothetical protein
MSASFVASAKASRTASVLCCGRAGELWREDLARYSARLDDLRRLSGWVEPMVRKVAWAGVESLFGQCLEECTSERSKSVRRRQSPRRYKKDATFPTRSDQGAEKKNWELLRFFPPAGKRPGQGADSSEPLPENLRSSKRATQELLYALSTPISRDFEERLNFPSVSNPDPVRTRPLRDFLKFCSEPQADSPAQKSTPTSLHHTLAGSQNDHRQRLASVWRENISWRASQALRFAAPTIDESGAPNLIEHWAVPLAGPHAPSDILTLDREFDSGDSTALREEEPQKLAVSEVWEPMLLAAQPDDTEVEDTLRKIGVPEHYANARAEAENESHSEKVRTGSAGPGELRADPRNSALWVPDPLRGTSLAHASQLPRKLTTHSTPPTLAPTGPDVLSDPAQARNRTVPETWQVGVIEEEELRDLSQKLQRILEDEALRFGVNV